MKKLIVMGIAAVMLMSVVSAANAAFVKDTDWAVYIQAGNNTWGTTNNWGSAGAEIKLGNASAPAQTAGTGMTSTTTAYVRDMSGGGANGYVVNTVAALDQTAVEQVQTWDNIVLFVGSTYGATTLSLRIWTTGISADGPALRLTVADTDANTGFTLNQVLFDSTVATNETTDTSKHYPWTTINLYPNLAGLKAADAANAHVTLRLTATTPASVVEPPVPEPGSMLAMFSGLVGLVGFGIRRRK